jgi:hypothetical protein
MNKSYVSAAVFALIYNV